MKRFLLAAGLCLLTACQSTGSATQVTSGGGSPSVGLTGSFGADLNAFRAAQGRGAVQPNALLRQAAQLHAEDMNQRGYFSHQSPGGPNGNDMAARVAATGCQYRAVAENIARGQTSEAQVFSSWQDSSGHRRNMLGAQYDGYGLGRSGNTWVLVLSRGC
ncbi:CAP domain-containing protein [Yoonia sp. BS5-3]|uniref:CAP domain-containing protein n=1 Tax=Yoonia phaeophyticola TaxID=3137369 RepID=A0ABZ2V9I2_9RHOB